MKTVFKYSLSLVAHQTIRVPEGIRILSVQMQQDTIQMWGLVDDKATNRNLEILIFGTGHDIIDGDDLMYLGTLQPRTGMLVWHVFAKNDRNYAKIVKL